MKSETEHNITDKKSSWRKNAFAAVTLLLFIFAVLGFILLTQEPDADPESEAVIRRIAADRQFYKDPNELTDEDFTKIERIRIVNKELCDIELLEKFTNLKYLNFTWVKFPDKEIPKWMKILGKTGIIDIKRRTSIDLKPLAKLEKLKEIEFISTPVKSVEPLSNLENLDKLSISVLDIHDFDSLKTLKYFDFYFLCNTSNTQKRELQEPFKSFKILHLFDVSNITDEQIEELQRAIPEKNIQRSRTVIVNPWRHFQ